MFRLSNKLYSVLMTIVMWGMVLMAVYALIQFFLRIPTADTELLSLVLALAAGLLFESYRVTRSRRQVGYTLMAALVAALVLCQVVPSGKLYLYAFAGYLVLFYSLFFLGNNSQHVTPDRSEGQAWLLSLCLVYWFLELYTAFGLPAWMLPVAALLAIPVGISGCHAFLRLPLSDGVRTWLGVWCIVITLALGVDNTVSVLFPSAAWSSADTFDYPARLFAFFLLGISAIYVFNDLQQLYAISPIADFPDEERQKFRERHTLRFSPRQVPAWQSAVCLVYAAVLFGVNFTYGLLPRITVIWLVIVSFPPLLGLVSRVLRKPDPGSVETA